METRWPASPAELVAAQRRLGDARPRAWAPAAHPLRIAAAWVCFPRGQSGAGARGDPAWAAVVLLEGRQLAESAVATGEAGAPYQPGLLALREGPILEAAVRGLKRMPDVLLIDATGRDHPRRAGLALHLGAVLELPTVGITDRPLLAAGPEPAADKGARADLRLDDDVVACRLRTRMGARPVVVHPAWRTNLEAAVAVVLAACRGHRAPEAMRVARRLAREARAR